MRGKYKNSEEQMEVDLLDGLLDEEADMDEIVEDETMEDDDYELDEHTSMQVDLQVLSDLITSAVRKAYNGGDDLGFKVKK